MKRWLLGLFIACVAVFSALPALAAPDVTMKAQLAGGGRIRAGAWGTVLVDLNNQGGEVEAELEVDSEGPNGTRTQYAVPLTIPAGASKRIPIDVALDQNVTLQVSLRSGGKLIHREEVPLFQLSPMATFVGVLSEDELGIPGLSQIGTGDDKAQVARLDTGTFPSRAALLTGYDVIALSHFDASALTKEQVQALEVWVNRGGTLLLAGGPEWKRTLAPLPASLLPVTVTGVGEADLASLGSLVAKPLTGKAPVSLGTVERGQVLLASGGTPLLVEDRVGAGRVIYQAFDPGLEPVVRWQGQADLYERLLRVGTKTNWADTQFPGGPMQSALQRIPGLALPSLLVLGSLLSLYLLLAGPVNYWVLKRMDRREWSWVTVPLLSLAFVGAVYGTGYSKQVTLVSHVITVTELYPGAKGATMTSYMGIYAPSRDRLTVPLDNARLVRPLHMGFDGSDQGRVSARVVVGERTQVELLSLNNYSMKGFAVEQDIVAAGGLALTDVTLADDGTLTGRVTNRLDREIKDIIVLIAGQSVSMNNLQPGETSGQFAVDVSRSANPMGKGGGFNAQFRSDMRRDLEAERKQMVLSATFGWEGSGLPAGSVVVTGWTDEPLANPALPALGRVTQGTNLVYASLPIPVDSARGDIPPGIIVGVRTGGAGFGRSPYGYGLQQGSHTFRFVLPPLDPARVADVKLHLTIMNRDGGYTPQVKNQKTGEWVRLEEFTMQSLPQWQDLLGAGGIMELRLDVDQYIDMAAPTLSVKGVAH